MLGFCSSLRIWLAVESVDFRKGVDGLCAIVRDRFGKNPLDGGVFVFLNKNKESIRLLFYDSQGFWLCQKRLSAGKFGNWPSAGTDKHEILSVMEAELSVLLRGGRIKNLKLHPVFRQINGISL